MCIESAIQSAIRFGSLASAVQNIQLASSNFACHRFTGVRFCRIFSCTSLVVTMSEDIELKIEHSQESWFNSWFRWCPTSPGRLREAEKKIFEHLKSAFKVFPINIGNVVGSEENQVWTLSANELSPNTPLVLIHGFGSGIGLWCLNVDSLAKHRPVYAFDIIGFGRSSRPHFSSDAVEAEGEFVNSVEAWRAHIGLKKFIILGHSFGGFLAASYAIKYPEHVSHLILADPWGFPERPLDVEQRYNLPLWVKAIGALVQPFNPLFIIRTVGPLGPQLIRKARPDMVRKFSGLIKEHDIIPSYLYHCNAQNPTGESAFHSMMSGFGWAKYPMIHRLESLHKDVPITLIYGARSWVNRDPGFQIKYTRQESYVDVRIIQAAGHHVYADRATEFNRLVNKIGQHMDEGTLPKSASTEQSESARSSASDTIMRLINVGHDTSRDPDFEEGVEESTGTSRT